MYTVCVCAVMKAAGFCAHLDLFVCRRLFSDAVSEVSSWLLSPATPPSEFLVLYLDNQPDLGPWGHVAEMLQQVRGPIDRG